MYGGESVCKKHKKISNFYYSLSVSGGIVSNTFFAYDRVHVLPRFVLRSTITTHPQEIILIKKHPKDGSVPFWIKLQMLKKTDNKEATPATMVHILDICTDNLNDCSSINLFFQSTPQ